MSNLAGEAASEYFAEHLTEITESYLEAIDASDIINFIWSNEGKDVLACLIKAVSESKEMQDKIFSWYMDSQPDGPEYEPEKEMD